MDVKISEFPTLNTPLSSVSMVPVIQNGDNYITSVSSISNTVETSTIVSKLQGDEADPTKIGSNYLPDTLRPNWIELQDMTGQTIPPNTIGQKSGTFYFGNSPLNEGVIFLANADHTPVTIASVPLPASAFSNGAMHWIDLEISAISYGLLSDSDQYILIIDYEEGSANDATTGSYVILKNNAKTSITMRGIFFNTVLGGFCLPDINNLREYGIFNYITQLESSGYDNTMLGVKALSGTIWDINVAGSNDSGGQAVNTAGSIIVKIVPIISTSISPTISISGKFKVILNPFEKL